jgi:hypothetical protein
MQYGLVFPMVEKSDPTLFIHGNQEILIIKLVQPKFYLIF